MARIIDLVLFGANGCTGQHVIPILHKLAQAKTPPLTWGIAGRSKQKLQVLRQQFEQKIGTSLNNIPVIVADVHNKSSLIEMAQQARIVLNCCGPYRFYGEPVVQVCIDEETHYVDISGEPHFMEEMQLKYSEKARQKGVYVISACGIDSIPIDLGVVFLQQKFNGTLNSINAFIEIWETKAVKSPFMTYGTWESAIHGLAHAKDLGAVRKKLFSNKLPVFEPKLQVITRPHKSKLPQGWAVPFPGADRSVVKRSQRFFYERAKKRPVQIEVYLILKSFRTIPKLAMLNFVVQSLAQYKRGQELLLEHPEKFSNGVFTKGAPSEEKNENSRFTVTLCGEGWKEGVAHADHKHTVPPNKAICGKVNVISPAYGGTCMLLVLSGIIVITETEKMPPAGGVYSPGYAFANTTLIEQLNQNGVTFEVVFEKDLLSAKY
ncbi:saccharopine dehydrogenase-like oxidoreductase [Zophobas morio]|uniref:saccharopine dehydrogenase-like oxidoreductase n=1 Tax=Zophobas morio TaxID=2755281 RepID=UPI0030839D75